MAKFEDIACSIIFVLCAFFTMFSSIGVSLSIGKLEYNRVFSCILYTPTVKLHAIVTAGVYFVIFLDEFGESRAFTAWIGSLNYAVLCTSGTRLQSLTAAPCIY